MLQELRASLCLLALFTLLTGVAYPWAVTGAGQVLFPHQANGSLVEQNGKIIGSELIGQTFADARYFHPRPSAAGNGYDAANSSGSNLALSAPEWLAAVRKNVAAWRKIDASRPIPVDLVTASGSGLDPDISLAAAAFQASAIAAARGIPLAQVQGLIAQNATPRTWGFLGEPRVNVLALNRALDLLESPGP